MDRTIHQIEIEGKNKSLQQAKCLFKKEISHVVSQEKDERKIADVLDQNELQQLKLVLGEQLQKIADVPSQELNKLTIWIDQFIDDYVIVEFNQDSLVRDAIDQFHFEKKGTESVIDIVSQFLVQENSSDKAVVLKIEKLFLEVSKLSKLSQSAWIYSFTPHQLHSVFNSFSNEVKKELLKNELTQLVDSNPALHALKFKEKVLNQILVKFAFGYIEREKDFQRFIQLPNQINQDEIQELIEYFAENKSSFSIQQSGIEKQFYQVVQKNPLAFYQRIKTDKRVIRFVEQFTRELNRTKQQYFLFQLFPMLKRVFTEVSLTNEQEEKTTQSLISYTFLEDRIGGLTNSLQLLNKSKQIVRNVLSEGKRIELLEKEPLILFEKASNSLIKNKYLELYDNIDLMISFLQHGQIPFYANLSEKSLVKRYVDLSVEKEFEVISNRLKPYFKDVEFNVAFVELTSFFTWEKTVIQAYSALSNRLKQLGGEALRIVKDLNLPEANQEQVLVLLLTNILKQPNKLEDATCKFVHTLFSYPSVDEQQLVNVLGSSLVSEFNKIKVQEIQVDFETEEIRLNYSRSDLLIYFLKENKLPWWANDKSIDVSKFLDDEIKRLVAGNYSELIVLLESLKEDTIAQKLVFSKLQRGTFERLLLAVAPNLAGFVVSFNILLKRAKPKYFTDDIMLFEFNYLYQESSIFDPKIFLKKAVRVFTLVHAISEKDFVQMFQGEAREALANNELKFIPFTTLFDGFEDFDLKEQKENLLKEIPPVMAFYEVFRYYLQTLTFPYPQLYDSFSEFFLQLEKAQKQEYKVLREIVLQSISSIIVQKNLIKKADQKFLMKLVEIIYPQEASKIQYLLTEFVSLINQTDRSVSLEVVLDHFYQVSFAASR